MSFHPPFGEHVTPVVTSKLSLTIVSIRLRGTVPFGDAVDMLFL